MEGLQSVAAKAEIVAILYLFNLNNLYIFNNLYILNKLCSGLTQLNQRLFALAGLNY